MALFHPSTGAEDGFVSSVEASVRGAGRLNALIVNNNEVSQDDWDIGLIYDPSRGFYLHPDQHYLLATAPDDASGPSPPVGSQEVTGTDDNNTDEQK